MGWAFALQLQRGRTSMIGGERPKDGKMTKDEMIEWFKSTPEGSRHHRMVWTAHKIARLTGATEGGAYQMLLGLLIEANETAAGLDLRD